MRAVIWVFVFGLLIVAVLLQDVPWLGIRQTWGRNPVVTATAIVIALTLVTVVMSLSHVLENLL